MFRNIFNNSFDSDEYDNSDRLNSLLSSLADDNYNDLPISENGERYYQDYIAAFREDTELLTTDIQAFCLKYEVLSRCERMLTELLPNITGYGKTTISYSNDPETPAFLFTTKNFELIIHIDKMCDVIRIDTLFPFKIKRQFIPEIMYLINYLNYEGDNYYFDYIYPKRRMIMHRRNRFSDELVYMDNANESMLAEYLYNACYYREELIKYFSEKAPTALLYPDDEGYNDDEADVK